MNNCNRQTGKYATHQVNEQYDKECHEMTGLKEVFCTNDLKKTLRGIVNKPSIRNIEKNIPQHIYDPASPLSYHIAVCTMENECMT